MYEMERRAIELASVVAVLAAAMSTSFTLALRNPLGRDHFKLNLVATYFSASSVPSRTVLGPCRT